ncbi:MAG: L-aspartate oxidase [Acidobacteriota bacterium]
MRTLDARSLVVDVIDGSDAVVIGSGVAGLTAALALAPRRVTLLTKTTLGGGGSSPWAQGGVAAAMADDDSPRLHAVDTLEAGAGLSDPWRVDILTHEGPERVAALIEMGADFDRDDAGRLTLGREGAHRRRRVLHADGDATGAEIVRALVAAVTADPRIEVHEHAAALDLALDGSRVVGVVARHGVDVDNEAADGVGGRAVLHHAPAVVLATGGFGQIYSHTTNPPENTGDGLAMAARAGAELIDLEMVQFHPTALDVEADPLPLVTEALRGEGAILIDEGGRRFMLDIHPMAELAPRDIVARAIWTLQSAGGRAFLDAREAVGAAFPERFPTVWSLCRDHGIDPRREPIPVTPAQHYAMAGVTVDDDGRTSLGGLWACGEVTASGVHGANRLASNSLLEALVFGRRVAVDIDRALAAADRRPSLLHPSRPRAPIVRREDRLAAEDPALRAEVRSLLWREVGLVRDRAGLERALDRLADLGDSAVTEPGATANLVTVARLVAAAALAREESRGGHHRSDFPDSDIVWKRRLAWRYRPGRPTRSPLEPVLPAPLELPAVASTGRA